MNVFAPGEQVQSAFVRGREDASTTDDHGADRFRSNTALWSGTSFACGYVSGYLAGVLAELPPAATPGARVARADAAIDVPARLQRSLGLVGQSRPLPHPGLLDLRRHPPLRFGWLLLAPLGNASGAGAVRRPSRTHRTTDSPRCVAILRCGSAGSYSRR